MWWYVQFITWDSPSSVFLCFSQKLTWCLDSKCWRCLICSLCFERVAWGFLSGECEICQRCRRWQRASLCWVFWLYFLLCAEVRCSDRGVGERTSRRPRWPSCISRTESVTQKSNYIILKIKTSHVFCWRCLYWTDKAPNGNFNLITHFSTCKPNVLKQASKQAIYNTFMHIHRS